MKSRVYNYMNSHGHLTWAATGDLRTREVILYPTDEGSAEPRWLRFIPAHIGSWAAWQMPDADNEADAMRWLCDLVQP